MQRSLAHPWAAVVTIVTLIHSRSSDNHTYHHPCVYVSVYTYIYIYLFLSPHSLPNSVFLLDTGSFSWATTSCRPCHSAFLPGFHHLLCEYAVFCVARVCVCVFCVTVCTDRQTHREISEIVPAHARTHTCRDPLHTLELRWWRVRRWFVLAPHTNIRTQTHKYAYLFVCFSEYISQLFA